MKVVITSILEGGGGDGFNDLTESTADLLKNWFSPTPRLVTPRAGSASSHTTGGPCGSEGRLISAGGGGGGGGSSSPGWFSLLTGAGRSKRVSSNPLGQTIREDMNFWPVPPSPRSGGGWRWCRCRNNRRRRRRTSDKPLVRVA